MNVLIAESKSAVTFSEVLISNDGEYCINVDTPIEEYKNSFASSHVVNKSDK